MSATATAAEPDPLLESLRAEEKEHSSACARLATAIELGAGEVDELASRRATRSRQLADVRALLAREATSTSDTIPEDLDAKLQVVARDARTALLSDPARAREVLFVVLRGRARVS